MLQDALSPFAQQTEVNAETGVGGLSAGEGLEEQVYRRAALQAGELRADMR